jgi:phasin family protein
MSKSAQKEDKSLSPGKGPEPIPAFDFGKLLKDFKLPGVDFAALIERERKNIEALAEANRIAYEGWQGLVRRQAEIFQNAMKHAVEEAKAEDAVKRRGDLARNAFESALSNMRELAEMAAKSQKDAFDIVRKRVEENLAELTGRGAKK